MGGLAQAPGRRDLRFPEWGGGSPQSAHRTALIGESAHAKALLDAIRPKVILRVIGREKR